MRLFCVATATCRALKIALPRQICRDSALESRTVCVCRCNSMSRGASKSFPHLYGKSNQLSQNCPEGRFEVHLESLTTMCTIASATMQTSANLWYQNGLPCGHWRWKRVKLPKSSVLPRTDALWVSALHHKGTAGEPQGNWNCRALLQHLHPPTVLSWCMCSILFARIEGGFAQACSCQFLPQWHTRARTVQIEKSRYWEKAFICSFTYSR